jgi:hypothetical protein
MKKGEKLAHNLLDIATSINSYGHIVEYHKAITKFPVRGKIKIEQMLLKLLFDGAPIPDAKYGGLEITRTGDGELRWVWKSSIKPPE